jgi:hypothetical protein
MNKKILLPVVVCALQSSAVSLSGLDFHVPHRNPSIDTEPGHAKGGITEYKLEGSEKKAAVEDVTRIAGNNNFISRLLLMITNYGESKNFYTITGQDGLTFGIKDFTGGGLTPLMALIQERYPGDVEAAFGKEWANRVLDKVWTNQWTNKDAERKGLTKDDKGLVTIREVRIGLDRILTSPRYRGAQLERFREETVEPMRRLFDEKKYQLEFSLAALAGVANSFGPASENGARGRLERAEKRAASGDEKEVIKQFVGDYVMRDAKTPEQRHAANKLLETGFGGGDVSKIHKLAHSGRRFRLAFVIFPWKDQATFDGDLGEFQLRDDEKLATTPQPQQKSEAVLERPEEHPSPPSASATPRQLEKSKESPHSPSRPGAVAPEQMDTPGEMPSASPEAIPSGVTEERDKPKAVLPAGKKAKKWLETVRNIDLTASEYTFPKLDGHTSCKLKVKKNGKAIANFLPPNSSGNPDTEVAYFNMARVVGYEEIIRPAAPFTLGPRAIKEFKNLLEKERPKNKQREENRKAILRMIAKNPNELKGALQAKKPKDSKSYDEIIKNNRPKMEHQLMQFVQADRPMPRSTDTLPFGNNHANALELARAWSILMTFDAIFGQTDRYSGGNVSVVVDKDSSTFSLRSTDNGGAKVDLIKQNFEWFSRYDRRTISTIETMNDFLINKSETFFGYTDAKKFVTDLGLYLKLVPGEYVDRLSKNCNSFLTVVRANKARYREDAVFFPEPVQGF